MIIPLLINYATLLSYIAFSTDLLLQIARIYRRKSSSDVSWKGIVFRLSGSLIILIKFLTLKDTYLIVGQIIFTLTVVTYLVMAIYYRKPKK